MLKAIATRLQGRIAPFWRQNIQIHGSHDPQCGCTSLTKPFPAAI